MTNFHRSHTLDYTNGYVMQRRPTLGVGGVPISYNQLSEQDLDELASYNPSLTYGQAKQAPPEEFVPAYVALDKKVGQCFLHLFSYFYYDFSFKRIFATKEIAVPAQDIPVLAMVLLQYQQQVLLSTAGFSNTAEHHCDHFSERFWHQI